MQKQQIIIVGIILSIISHFAVSAYAEIKEVNLHIDGLSCHDFQDNEVRLQPLCVGL